MLSEGVKGTVFVGNVRNKRYVYVIFRRHYIWRGVNRLSICDFQTAAYIKNVIKKKKWSIRLNYVRVEMFDSRRPVDEIFDF